MAVNLDSITLTKGERTDINPELTKCHLGGGWDINAGTGAKYDLDIAAFLLRNGKFTDGADMVYFGNKKHASGAAELDKDNLTGAGEGDDEKIFVDLSKVPLDVSDIVFSINIFEAVQRDGQNFGKVENAFVRLVAPGEKELVRFNLTEKYSAFNAIIACKLYRFEGKWKFAAIGDGFNGTIKDIATKFA